MLATSPSATIAASTRFTSLPLAITASWASLNLSNIADVIAVVIFKGGLLLLKETLLVVVYTTPDQPYPACDEKEYGSMPVFAS